MKINSDTQLSGGRRPARTAVSTKYPKYVPPKRPLRPVRKRRFRGRFVRAFSVVAAVFLLGGGFFAWKTYASLHKVFRGSGTVAALSSDVDPALLASEGSGRVNVLVLGVGGPGHQGPDLTDTMIILSVDPVNDTAVMFSVPRDLWVKMPVNYFGNYQKINAAYESGKYHYIGRQDSTNKNGQAVQAGFAAVDQVLKEVLDVHINYHVLVNFSSFRQAINTVGGVTVDVPSPLYDPTMAWENNWNPVLARAGVQTMNGQEALLYARSRETSSDFARSERQRQIIVALKDKILAAGTLSNPAKINGLLDAFGDNIYSDMSIDAAEKLYGIMKNIGDDKLKSVSISDAPNKYVTTDHVGNISVVRPVAGFNNYAAIQRFVRSQLPDGHITKERAGVAVVNGGVSAAAVQAVADDLRSYGYTITSVDTAATAATVRTTQVIAVKGVSTAPYTQHYLEEHFSVKAATKPPMGITLQPGSAKFVIIVGQDEATITQD